MQYFVKVTIAWTVFLLIYELLYKNNGRFLMNRLYLMLSLFAGLLLPLISLPFKTGVNPVANVLNNPAGISGNILSNTSNAGGAVAAIDWYLLIWWGYGIVAGVLFISTLLDLIYILRHAIYSNFQSQEGHKLFRIDKAVAPYSFMGWIFLSNATAYDETALNYVITHEAAHNQKLHWVDNLIMQTACILLWFHPLVWRYRYLLKMQHEYEADYAASNGDTYEYGHFLLEQNLMRGVPSIAHSFHFSPLKNRINMLTKNQKSGLKKYLLIVPVLALSVLVMAKDSDDGTRKRTGNLTSYRGNIFEWEKASAPDTFEVEDPVTGKINRMISRKDPSIIKMNKEIVIDYQRATNRPQFKSNDYTFGGYLKKRLAETHVKVPEKIAQITVRNIVLDTKGKVVYFDLSFMDETRASPAYDYDPVLSPALESIIADSPEWSPAFKDGKPFISYINSEPNTELNFKDIR